MSWNVCRVAAKQLLEHGPDDLLQAWQYQIVVLLQHKRFCIEGAVGYRARTAHRYWPMSRKR